jgi:GTPase SAR1 family protein
MAYLARKRMKKPNNRRIFLELVLKVSEKLQKILRSYKKL